MVAQPHGIPIQVFRRFSHTPYRLRRGRVAELGQNHTKFHHTLKRGQILH